MSWSYSKLSTYEQCPLKKKYKYDDKLVSTAEKHPAAQRGTDMHDDLERNLGGETVPEWMRPHIPHLEMLEGGLRECRIHLDEDWQPVAEEERELVAILDLLKLNDAAALIVDYKTGKRYAKHVEQIELYMLAVLAQYPELELVQGRCYYLDEPPGSWSRPQFLSREAFAAVRKRWDDRVAMMNVDTECAPRSGWYCRFCDYRKSEGGPCRFG